MEQYVKELEAAGCIMIPGLYTEPGDAIENCQYFYFTKDKRIGFGAIGLVDGKHGIAIFDPGMLPEGWALIEDFIKAYKEILKE